MLAQFKYSFYLCNTKLNKHTKHKIMETMINTLAAQAAELMKNQHIVAMLSNCATEEEKQMKLAIAAMYAIAKVNA